MNTVLPDPEGPRAWMVNVRIVILALAVGPACPAHR